MNFEKTTPEAEREPTPAHQLFIFLTNLSALDKQSGAGQVQIQVGAEQGHYMDSPIARFEKISDDVVITALSLEGAGQMIRYRSIGGSAEQFTIVDENKEVVNEGPYTMHFPGFTQKNKQDDGE